MTNNSKTAIVYLAHGIAISYNQVIFSILSLYHQQKGNLNAFQVVIYTDNPEFFKKYLEALPIAYEVLTKERIREYKGPHSFIHRVKVLILRDCLEKYRLNTIYFDGDTFFLQPLESLTAKLSANVGIMHANEYDLYDAGMNESKVWFALRRTLRRNRFHLQGKDIEIPLSTRMWNAGVLGVSFESAVLLNDVISLTDQIYDTLPIFTVEQFANSYILQTHLQMMEAKDFVYHYWERNEKLLMNYHITRFLQHNKNNSISENAGMAEDLFHNRAQLSMPPIEKPSTYHKLRSRIKRLAQLLLKG